MRLYTLHSIPEGFSVTIMSSSTTEEAVSIDALRDLRTIGLCRLISPGSSSAAILFPSALPIHNRQRTSKMLCDSDDDELGGKDSKKKLLPEHCPREFPGTKLHPFFSTTNRSFHSNGCSCQKLVNTEFWNFCQNSGTVVTI